MESGTDADFADPLFVMFRESTTDHMQGGLGGRMPYYMAAHGLFAAAVCEMLLQNVSGAVRAFPACPWKEASFVLWANGRPYHGSKKGDTISLSLA